MKTLCNSKLLPVFTVILGGVGYGLRWTLYRQTVDSKNLIPVGHPYEWILWAVTALAAVLVIAKLWPLHHQEDAKPFRPAPVAAVGCVIGAAGILTAVLGDGGDQRFPDLCTKGRDIFRRQSLQVCRGMDLGKHGCVLGACPWLLMHADSFLGLVGTAFFVAVGPHHSNSIL